MDYWQRREVNMGTATMGKVLVTATIENLEDLFQAQKGVIPAEQVRRVEVADALVDNGATGLLAPGNVIARLGLSPVRTRNAKTVAGTTLLQVYRAVRLSVQGRDCILDISEVPDDCPVIIGQIPLEAMDWVVDPRNQQLIGNPAHGGEQMLEVYRASTA
jgi:hypothetical protein